MKPEHQSKTPTEPLAARLKPEQVATYVGCFAHDIPILVRAGLLKPLGRVPPNAVKYFSKRKVLELCGDDGWLARVTDAIARHWQQKNGRRREPSSLSNRLATGRASNSGPDANPGQAGISP